MSNQYIKTSFAVTAILFIGYIISFVKEMVIADYFGVSAEVDAYTLAITIPVNLFAIFAVSIQPIVIPIYSKVLYSEGCENARNYLDSLITLIVLASATLIILIELFAVPVAYIFAPGLDNNTRYLVVTLLRITTPTIVFSLLDRVFMGMLNVYKKFAAPSLSVYFLNLGIILTIVIFHVKWGILSACIGQVIGSILQVSFLVYLARKYYSYSIKLDVSNSYIKQTLKNVVPILWSTSISEMNALVNRAVASFLFAGAIAALGYSTKVNSVIILFFTSAISTIIYPMYAEAAVKKDIDALNSRINLTLSIYLYLLLPLMAGVFVLKKELIEIAFARGAFDMEAVALTQSLLGCYSFGIVFIALRESITKVFYSMNDTKTPAVNTSLGIMLNIILSLILPRFLGVEGLALASSISAAFITISLVINLKSKCPTIKLNMFFSTLRQLFLPLVIMIACLELSYNYLLSYSSISVIIGCAIIGFISFVSISYILKIEVFMIFFRKIIAK